MSLDKINLIFPKERYTVSITGKAYVFEKGTHYLIGNLVQSLLFAVLLISFLSDLYVHFSLLLPPCRLLSVTEGAKP